MLVLVMPVYFVFSRDSAFILSKVHKLARLLETAPVRGKIRYAIVEYLKNAAGSFRRGHYLQKSLQRRAMTLRKSTWPECEYSRIQMATNFNVKNARPHLHICPDLLQVVAIIDEPLVNCGDPTVAATKREEQNTTKKVFHLSCLANQELALAETETRCKLHNG